MNIINLLRRPEYFFHPIQIFRRMASANKELPKVKTVKLPWGAEISVRLKENLGSAIYWYGIHDRIVPETIWRLMDRGETGIDIGANIGQNRFRVGSAFRRGGPGHCV